MPTTPTYEEWGFVFQSPIVRYNPQMSIWCKLHWGEPLADWLMSSGGDCVGLDDPVVFWFKTQDQLTQFLLTWC